MMSNAFVAKEIADRLHVRVEGGAYVQPLDGVTIQNLRPSTKLKLMPCGIQIDLETGEVVIPEGLDLTDAARAFWAAVQHVSGYRQPGFW